MPTTETPQRPRSIPRLRGVSPLPESLLPLAPEPVQEASQALAEALSRHGDALRARNAARAAVESAAAADASGAAAAAESGQALPDALLPKARADLTEAERTTPATELAARRRQYEFLTALHDGREQMLAAAADALAEIGEPMLSLVDEIEAALMQRLDLHALIRELGTGEYLQGKAPVFNLTRPRPGRDPLKGGTRELLDALRSTLAAEAEQGNTFITGGGR